MTLPVVTGDRLDLPLLTGERWWGGAVADGQVMPMGGSPHRRDLATWAGFNQSAPLLVSSRGRYVWSEWPFEFAFDGMGRLEVTGSELVLGQGEPTLGGAFRAAAAAYFPAAGRTVAAPMLAAPQYNTWVELPYRPTQDAVLAYVRSLLDAGFPPGLVMIDDRWSVDYGDWRFDRTQFPDPTAMTETLHAWGCTVMVWLVPFVSPDSENFRTLEASGLLVRRSDGNPAIRRWWNGYSAVLDLTNPEAVRWLRARLDALVDKHGIDGFKFDAGDLRDYRTDDLTAARTGLVGQCEAWARIGLDYQFNEFRACWKMGGQPLAQRLHDKLPTWGHGGLGSLVLEGIAQGLIGHPYICPDMIGGGELSAFADRPLDQQLFVRYAQCAALFPMMQFSMSPWRVLDSEHLAAVLAAVDLHQALVPELIALAQHAAQTGEPILRPLAYAYPGYEDVDDQFLLGSDLLCAPVLAHDADSRHVVIPPGRWRGTDGHIAKGPTHVDVPVTLESIPLWRRALPRFAT